MFYVYFIYSESLDTFYIGQTLDPDQRLEEHNTGFFENTFTCKTDGWKLFYTIECQSRNQAILIERHIKKMRSRKYYHSLKSFPEIAIKLKHVYNAE